MEYQDGVGGSLGSSFGLEQFASVALQDAAMNAANSRRRRSESHEDQMILGAEGFPNFSAYDEYPDDPRFLESQREFRDLLLTSAQSLAPTRVGSPVNPGTPTSPLPTTLPAASIIRQIISTRERVIWLRKYIDEVAPWVRDVSFHNATYVSNLNSLTCLMSSSTSRLKYLYWRNLLFHSFTQF